MAEKPIQNIDLFNASAALIFEELYRNVPVPVTLNYQNLSSSLFADNDSISRQSVIEVFINTVTWLKKSGYIWLDSESELDVYGALLSPKGLEVLSIIPESSNNNETIGEHLASNINEGDNIDEYRATLVKVAIAAGINIS